jgi:hypothetical protein
MEHQIRRSVVWGVIGALVGGVVGFYYGSRQVSAVAFGGSSSFISADSDELFLLLCALIGAAVVGFGAFMLAHVFLDRR